MNPKLRKIAYVSFWYLIYPQVWYIYLIPELFYYERYVLELFAIFFTYIIGIIDTYYRPFSGDIKEDLGTNSVYNLVLLVFFLCNPLLVVGAFIENRIIVSKHIVFWDNLIISFLGIFLLIIGGLLTITGRAQLSQYGSGVLHIEEDHKLVTTGIYGIIRHPYIQEV